MCDIAEPGSCRRYSIQQSMPPVNQSKKRRESDILVERKQKKRVKIYVTKWITMTVANHFCRMPPSESVVKIVNARHDIRNPQELTTLWALEGVQVRSKGSPVIYQNLELQNQEMLTMTLTKRN